MVGSPLEAEVARQFWAQVRNHPDPAVTCWIYTGSLRSDGYGRLTIEGHEVRAHRFSYESAVGPIPKGLVPDHLCSRRACIHPLHLEPVTPVENSRRARLRALYASRGRALPPGFRTIIPDDHWLPKPDAEAWI